MLHRSLLFSLAALFSAGCADPSDAALSQRQDALTQWAWRPLKGMGTARSGHTTTALSDGRLLITGGANASGAVLDTAEIYDPRTQTFSPVPASMGSARRDHSATRLADGSVLLAGGSAGGGKSPTAELYVPANNTFVAVQGLKKGRSGHVAVPLGNGFVAIAGGASGDDDTPEYYVPADQRFRAADAIPSRVGAAGAPWQGRAILIGGRGKDGVLDALQSFDSQSLQWSNAGSKLISARELATAVALQNNIWVAGGANENALNSTELVIPGTASQTGPTLIAARARHAAAALSDGRVLVVGGRGEGNALLASAETLELSGTMAGAGALPGGGRVGHTLTALDNGEAIALGGETEAGPVNAAELYTQVTVDACTSSTQCSSGFCVGGVCCDRSCAADQCGSGICVTPPSSNPGPEANGGPPSLFAMRCDAAGGAGSAAWTLLTALLLRRRKRSGVKTPPA